MSQRGALEPTMSCVKHLILGMNCLLIMTGMLLLAVGSTIKGAYTDFDDVLGSNIVSPASFLMAIGAIIFVVSFFGCVGAIRESTCLINLYTLCLIVVFIFEISGGLAGFVLQNNIRSTLSINMKNAIQHHYLDASANIQEPIDSIQRNLECCGAESPLDWEGVLSGDNYTLTEDSVIVPDSCCGTWNVTDGSSECTEPFTNGCLPQLVSIARSAAMLLTGAAITVALIQAMAIYFSNELAKAIRRAKSLRSLRQIEIRNTIANSYQPMSQDTAPSQKTAPVVYLSGGNQETSA